MVWRPKIKTKILIGFVLLSVFSVLSVVLFSLRQFENILKEQILSDLILAADMKEGHLFDFFESLKGRIADFSSDGLIRDLTAEISAGGDGRTRELLTRHLIENKMSLDKFLNGINVMDLNGRVIASTSGEEVGRDESAEHYFLKAKELNYGESYIHDTFVFDHFAEERIAMIGVASLTDNESGRKIGVIANYIDIKNLNEIMTGERQIRLGALSGILGRIKTFEVYLMNADGFPLTELKFAPGAVLSRKTDILPVRKCREGKQEIAALYENYLNSPVLGASMCLPNGWTLVLEMSQEEALGRVGDVRRSVLLLMLAVMAVSGGIAYRIARGIANPIASLAQTAEKIKSGDFSQKAKVASEDEIGRLSVSFNEMIDKMNKRVEESEKLSVAMVGRELRMVELKKEMEELKKKAGTAGENQKEK